MRVGRRAPDWVVVAALAAVLLGPALVVWAYAVTLDFGGDAMSYPLGTERFGSGNYPVGVTAGDVDGGDLRRRFGRRVSAEWSAIVAAPVAGPQDGDEDDDSVLGKE